MVRVRIQLIKIWVLNCSNIIRKLLSGEDEDTEWLEQIQFLSYSKLLDDRPKQDLAELGLDLEKEGTLDLQSQGKTKRS